MCLCLCLFVFVCICVSVCYASLQEVNDDLSGAVTVLLNGSSILVSICACFFLFVFVLVLFLLCCVFVCGEFEFAFFKGKLCQ